MAGPSPILYILRIRKHSGETLDCTPSIREMPGTKRLAQSILRLMPAADFVDIRPYDNGVISESSTLVYREAANEESRT